MSLYAACIPQLTKMLDNLGAWLDKAVASAETRGFDAEVLLSARLAPDQYPLSRQVQMAADAAKFAGARLAGKDAPVHPDTESTVAELSARLRATASFLRGLTAADFEGAAGREIHLPVLPGKFVHGTDYLNELALPNFYFHATTVYAILRHNGVDLGKRDYIGGMNLHEASEPAS